MKAHLSFFSSVLTVFLAVLIFLPSVKAQSPNPIKVAVISQGAGQENSGYQAIVNQLNDDSYFNFTATMVNPTDVDTVGELNAYNAVVMGHNGIGVVADTIYAAALKNWVQAGGGVVMTGWGVFGSDATEINDIIPVNTVVGYQFVSGGQLVPNATAHPVTAGVSTFTSASYIEFSGGVDFGSTTLATSGAGATVVVASSGSGKSAYLGPIYSGSAQSYANGDLRSGNADRLLEQAVAWVAAASAAPTNTAPTLAAINKSGTEDTTVTFAAADFTSAYNDADSNPLSSITIVSLPATGALKLSGSNVAASQVIPAADLGNLTYVPAAHESGAKTFTMTASDGTASSTPATTVTMTLSAVNDVPSFVLDSIVIPPGGLSTSGNAPYSLAGAAINISPGPANESTQAISFIVTNSNNALFSSQPTISSDGTFAFTSAVGVMGSATVSVVAKDNGGTANGGVDTSAAQTFTVTKVNTAPTAVADAFATPTDISRTISSADLVGNDTDVDGQTLTVTSVQGATNGASVSLNGGVITYIPAPSFTGSAAFTYSISDGAGGTANGTVTMTINSSAPVVLNDSTMTITAPTTITNPVTFSGDGGLSTTQPVTLQGPVTVTGTPTIETTTTVTIIGPIDGAGELEKKGSGTLNLMVASSFTGGVKATAGEIGIGHDEALGEGKVTLGGGTLTSMSELKVIGNEVQIDANTTIKGAGLGIAGDVVMNGSRAIETIGNLDISGNISDSSGKSATITKVGGGDLILAGDNTFSGGVVAKEGTLGIASDTAAGTGKVTLAGGTLEAIGEARQISNPVEVKANVVFAGETLTLDGPTQITGTPKMDLQADVNLTDKVTNNNSAIEAGITKEGPAALTLTETSTLEVPIVVQDGDVNANGVTTAEIVLAIPASATDPFDEGKYASQAIVNGFAAISFFEENNDDLKFQIASNADATTWEVAVTVDSAGEVGQFTSLAVVNGNPAISYYDATNGDLKFVRALNASGSTWGTPITLASSGDVGQHTSLLVVNGNPAIAYYDETNGDLKFIRASDPSGSIWGAPITVTATGDVGQFASLKIVSGFPAIAFHDVTNGDLLYSRATNADGSSWGSAVVVEDSGVVGAYASLCVVDGRPAISYFDATEDLVTTSNSALHLCYIRSSDATGTSWPGSAVIVDASSRNVGHFTSLQVVNGHPAVSYQDFEAENLKYAWSDDAQGAVWPDDQKVIVEEVGQVGKFCSLQVVNGKPGISFYDDTRDDIEHKVFQEVADSAEVAAPPPAFFGSVEGLLAAPPPSSAASKAASAKGKTDSRAKRGSSAKKQKKGSKKGAKANKKKPRKTGKNGKSKTPKKPKAAASSSQVTQSGAQLPKPGKKRVPEMLRSGSTLSIAGAKKPAAKKSKGSAKGSAKKPVAKSATGVGSLEVQEDYYIEGGSSWDLDIAAASGPKGKKGIGWDHVKVGGDLEIAASVSKPISIKLRPSSLSKSGSKGLTNFSRLSSYEWEILSVGGTISGFAPGHFRVLVDPDLKKITKGGLFQVIQRGKTLRIAYTPPATPPPGAFAFAPPPPLEDGPLPPPGFEPDIAIQKDLGAVNLTSGSLTPVDFGGVNTGATQTLTFTLSNTGAADLTDLDFQIAGTHSIDFRVIEFPTDILTSGATAPVVIEFEPSASGARSAVLNVLSNDPDEVPFEINLSGTGNPAPEIAVANGGADLTDGAATAVSYGLISVNSTKDVSFTVSNIGSLDLTGLTVTLDGANADQFSITPPLAVNSLVSGDSALFTVRFAPMTSGVKTAAIHIPSNDADEPSFDINLTGEGVVAPEIAVELASVGLSSGETIDAGAVATGSTADLTFTIKNLGSASLTGIDATFSGANATNFSVITPASVSVSGGGSTTLTIRFAPTTSGAKSAVLQIANNDADESPFDVRLSSLSDHEIQTGTISSVLSGNVDLSKTGAGSAILAGANTFTGTATIAGGTLTLSGTSGGNNALPTNGTPGDNDVFINGGSLQIGGSEQIGNNAGIVLSTGSFGFSGSGLTETIGTFTNNGGTFSTGANTLIGTGNTITWAGGTNTVNAGGTSVDTHYSITGGTNTVEGGATGGTLRVLGGGLGLEFDGTNSPTITLNSDAAQAGRILLEGNVNVLAGLTSGTAQILNGGVAANPGYIDMNGGTRTFTVANGSAATDLLISALVTNGALTKAGAGTLELSGVNTYADTTTVSAGTLSITGSINSSATIAVNGGLLSTNGADKLADAASVTVAGGTLTIGGNDTVGTLAMSSGTIGGSSTLTATTYSLSGGTVDGNLGAGTLNSSGTVVLNGTAAATTVNVTAGTLTLGSSNRLADAGAINLTGGTLAIGGFSDTVGAVTLSSGSITGSGGVLTGSSYAVESGTISAILAGSGVALTKTTAGTVTLSGANTYSGGTTVSAGTIVLGNQNGFGTGTVTLADGVSFKTSGFEGNSVAGALPNAFVLSSGTVNVDVSFFGANDMWINTSVSGAGGFSVSAGGGIVRSPGLMLSGAKTFQGGVTIGDNARVTIDNNASLGTGGLQAASGTGRLRVAGNLTGVTNNATIANGATLMVEVDSGLTGVLSGVISGSGGSLTKDSAGTLTLSGANTYTGATTISAGTLQIGNGGTTGSLSTSSAITNNATLAFNRSNTITQGTDFNSVISGGGAVTQVGSGTTILSGANTYTGATTVTTGVLNIRNASALGTTASGTSVASGAALQIQGDITTGAEALTLNGTGLSNDGVLRNISGSNDFAGLVTLSGTSRINSDAGTLNLSNTGIITGSGFGLTVGGAGNTTISGVIGTGSGTLTKDGAGTLTLSGANTYTGTTTVSAGTLALSGAGALADTTPVTLTGATGVFDISGITAAGETIGSLAGVAGSSLVLGGKTLTSGSLNTSTVFAGGISGVGGSLTKTGTGALTLSGANTYTGTTTINGGAILINNATAIGSGTLVAGGTARIDNTSAGAITLSNNNNVTLSGGSLTFDGTRDLSFGSGVVTISGANRTITASAGVLTFGGIDAAGTTLRLTKGGAGTLIITGAAGSNFQGGFLNSNGIVIVGDKASLGTGRLTMEGGILQASTDLSGANALTSADWSLTASSTFSGSNSITLANSTVGMDASRSISNDISAGKALTLGSFAISSDATARTLTITGSGATTFNGVISNGSTATASALTKNGTGTLTLAAANSYGGATTITAGTLALTGSGAISDSSALNLNGATAVFDLSSITAAGETVGSLAGVLSSSVILGGKTLTAGGDGTTTSFAGVISGTNGNLTKTGTGTLTLSGTNTFTGTTTVSDGTLTISGSINDSATIAVNGGLLSTTGAGKLADTAAVTVAGGTLTVGGADTVGTLAMSSGTIGGSATLTATTYGLSGGTVNGNLGTGTLNSSGTVALNGTAGATTVNISAGTLTLGSANRLADTAAINLTGGTLAIGGFSDTVGAVTLTSGSITGSGGVLTGSSYAVESGSISAILAGSGVALTKTTAGTVTLSGANTYTGTTTVSAGTLRLLSGAFSTTARAYAIASGAVLNLDGNTGVASGTTSLSGAGTLRITGGTFANESPNSSFGPGRNITMSLSSGALIDVQSGAVMVNGGWQNINWTSNLSDLNVDGTFNIWDGNTVVVDALTGAGSVIGTNAAKILTVGADNGTGTFSGVISSDTALTKIGTGTQTLSGVNTYTGTTTVSAGILNIQNASGLGATSGSTSVSNGATLQLEGGISIGAEGLTLNGGAASGQTGALVNVSGTNTYGGSVTIAANSAISAASGTVLNLTGGVIKNGTTATFNGGGTINVNTFGISGASVNSDLVIDGTTVNLNVANSYNGPTFIRNSGTLNANVAGALPVGTRSALTFDGTGISVLTLGAAQSVASLTGASTATITLGANNLTVGTSTGSTTFAGTIGGTGGLIKDGASTLVLSGSNNYTGLTDVQAGTLSLGANDVITNAASVKVSGGTFALSTFSDTVAGVQLTSGSITSSSGVLTSTSDYDVQAGSVSAVLSGAVGLTKTTSGTVTLSGANLYTGATAVSAGVLNIQSASALGTIAAGTSVASGAALEIQGGVTTLVEALTLNGTGISNGGALRNVSGTNTFAGLVTLGAATRINSDAGTLTLSNTGTIAGSGLALTVGGSGNTTIDSIIGTGTGTLIKDGSGTLTLTNTNTFTGATTINAGTLNLNGSIASGSTVAVSSLGTLSGTGTVNGNATLTGNGIINLTNPGLIVGTLGVTGGNWNGAGSVTGLVTSSSGTFTIGSGANLTASSGLNVTGGTIANGNGSSTITGSLNYTSASSSSFGGIIAGSGKTLTMNNGSATLTLSGANTYTGLTDVQAGTLAFGANNVIADTASVKVSGGVLAIGNRSDTVAGVQLTSGSITGGTGVLTSTSAFDVQSGTVSAILGGSVGLTKTTSGTVTLSGTNTYTGATLLSAGSLVVNGSIASSSLTTIDSGATLLGSGTVGPIQLNSGGTINPGAVLGAGTLTTGNINIVDGQLVFNLGGTGTYDSLAVLGTINLAAGGSGAQLVLNSISSYSATLNDAFTLADASSVSGAFVKGTFGGTKVITLSGVDYVENILGSNYYGRINYSGNSTNPSNLSLLGTDLVLKVVTPEITVTESGSNQTDGGTYDFGEVDKVVPAVPLTKTFTIKNDGEVDLLNIYVNDPTGIHSSDYSVNRTGTATFLPPGASTTFTITFDPSRIGTRTAAITIDSSDLNENPFNLALTGIGTIARDVSQPWTVLYGGVDEATIRRTGAANAVTIQRSPTSDSALAVFATGYTTNSNGDRDIYTAKYDPLTGAVLWEKIYATGGDDEAFAIAIDATGNIWVTGYSKVSNTDTNAFIAKYRGSDGDLLWSELYDGPFQGQERGLSIAVTSTRVVVAGHGMNSATSGYDLFAASYELDGTPVFSRLIDGGVNGHDTARAVAVDASGNIGIAGYVSNSNGHRDFSVRRLDKDTGNTVWEWKINGSSNTHDEAYDLAFDAGGNLLATGSVRNANYDLFTVKLNSGGSPIWQKVWNSTFNSSDAGYDINVDSAGNVVVGGTSYRASEILDGYVAKYRGTDGSLIWDRRFNGSFGGQDSINDIELDALNNVVATGFSERTSGRYDILTAKMFAADGGLVWEKRYNDVGYGVGTALAVSPEGNIYVGGYMLSAAGESYDFVVKNYQAVLPPVQTPQTIAFANPGTQSAGVDLILSATSSSGLPVRFTVAAGPAVISDSDNSRVSFTGETTTTLVTITATQQGNSQYARATPVSRTFSVVKTAQTIDFSLPATAPYTNTVVLGGAATSGLPVTYAIVSGPGEINGRVLSFTGDGLVQVSADQAGNARFNAAPQVVRTINASNTAPVIIPAGVQQGWTQSYAGSGASEGRAVALQVSGGAAVASFVAGYTTNASGNKDIYLMKYNNDGSNGWTNPVIINGPGNGDDEAIAVAVDTAGDVYISGYVTVGPGNTDAYVAKFTGATGAATPWTKTFAASAFGADSAVSLVLQGPDVVIGGSVTNIGTGVDFFAAKIKQNDVNVFWSKSINAGGTDYANAVAVGSDGSVALAGYANNDSYTILLDSATGETRWSRRYNAASKADAARGVLIDGNNDVIITAYSQAANYNIYTAKYSRLDGSIVWEHTYNSSFNSSDAPWAAALDPNGNVIVVGTSYTAASVPDAIALKYNGASGDLAWERRYNGPASKADEYYAVSVDAIGNPIMTGYSLNSDNTADIYTAKWSSSGGVLPLWEIRFNGAANKSDYARAIAADPTGRVWIAGYQTTASNVKELLQIKYQPPSAPPPPLPFFASDGDSPPPPPPSLQMFMEVEQGDAAQLSAGYFDGEGNETVSFTAVLDGQSAGAVDSDPTAGAFAWEHDTSAMAPGIHDLVITATDTAGASSSVNVQINIASNLADRAWRYNHFGTTSTSGLADFAADPDGDGLDNLGEFAFGLNPLQAADARESSRVSPSVGANGGLRAVFRRRKDHATVGLTYVAQFSSDLANWFAATDIPQVIADQGDTEEVALTFPLLPNGQQGRFFRVVVDPSVGSPPPQFAP